MRSLQTKPCPHCQQPFDPVRRNQKYCSTDCRIDANNRVAQTRYASFKKGEPLVEQLKERTRQLQVYLASLTVVIADLDTIDQNTVQYQGKTYRRGRKMGQPKGAIRLQPGGALLLPGNTILHIGPWATNSDSCYEYTPV